MFSARIVEVEVEVRVEVETVAAEKAVVRVEVVKEVEETAAVRVAAVEAYKAEAVGVMAAKERSLQSRIVYETFSEEIAVTAKEAASEAHPVESV